MSQAPELRNSRSGGSAKGNWLLPVVAIAAVVLFFAVRMNQQQPQFPLGREHAAVGTELTSFTLEPLLGVEQPAQLEGFRGQVTLVQFWGPWCYYCLLEFPALVELKEALAEETDFRILSISCEQGATTNPERLQQESQATMEKFKASWPVYSDSQQHARTAVVQSTQMRQGFAFPTTVLIDRDGLIAAVWVGYHPSMKDDVDQTVRSVLAAGS